jgi:hypothetical protein
MEKWQKGILLKDFKPIDLKQGNEPQGIINEGKTEF